MPKAVPRTQVVRAVAVVSAACVTAAVVGLATASHPTSQPSARGSVASPATAVTATDDATGNARGTAVGTALPARPAALVAPAHRATAALTAPRAVRVVHSCAQDVAPGHVACFAERRTDLPAQPELAGPNAPQAAPSGYGPADLAAAYALPSTTAGFGQTVYIIDAFDDPNAESDLATYRTAFGLPPCTSVNGCFAKMNQQGSTAVSTLPDPNAGWAGEISLDLDVVSAVCPNCHITLVEADSNDNSMFSAVTTANLLGAKFVSMSWGGAESSQDKTLESRFTATGVVYTAASGDDGYAKGPIYPATSARVVAVGGTSLTPAATSRGWKETAWDLAGSGCSTQITTPAWQAGATPCGKKGTTDVSAVADPGTGVAVFQTYGGPHGWVVYGGTSAAAPLIASVYALAGPPSTTVNPAALPYRNSHSLNDVTSGTNGTCSSRYLCTATTGWDGPTGLGTPNGLTAFTLGRGAHTTLAGQTGSPGYPGHGTSLASAQSPAQSPTSSTTQSPTSSTTQSPTSSTTQPPTG